jgi:hypothetical protein
VANDEDCIQYARDCDRLARAATDPHLREQLLQMAREWLAAAMNEPLPEPKALKGHVSGKHAGTKGD